MRVVIDSYSTFFDVGTGLQFSPVLDRRSGCYVAIADVSKAEAKAFVDRPAFRVVDDAEFLAMTARPDIDADSATDAKVLSETGPPDPPEPSPEAVKG